ncbi:MULTISPECIES: hypothetical protein [unclassified Bradyrhizobium]|uniref:hypothetical protein n=1 Tax=unclassified Bradyrhizobium TaxID=2631580 RepID=UPI002FF42BFB
MLGHRHTPVVFAAAINPALRDRRADSKCTHFVTPVGCGFGRRFYGMTGVLKQAPCALHIEVGEDGCSAFRIFPEDTASSDLCLIHDHQVRMWTPPLGGFFFCGL